MRWTILIFAGGTLIVGAALGGVFWERLTSASVVGDPAHGAQIFPACRACHSLEPGRNMSGPSLAGIWGRKAGSLESFERYSPALRASGIVWEEKTLDTWLKNPPKFVPGNRMTFPGIKDDKIRADLIAYLKAESQGRHFPGEKRDQASAVFVPLKELSPAAQVKTIRYCHDTYHVTTGNGTTLDFWEPNLRFKTDSSDRGPVRGAPAILDAGSAGDRASIIFADPDEISAAIKRQC